MKKNDAVLKSGREVCPNCGCRGERFKSVRVRLNGALARFDAVEDRNPLTRHEGDLL
jgi:hypothetical protein